MSKIEELKGVINNNDVIIASSMGKILCSYLFKKKICDGNIKFKGINSKVEIIVSDKLDDKGNLIVIIPDRRLSHINCVEYRLLDKKQRLQLEISNAIEEIRSKLIKITDKMLYLEMNNNGTIGIEDILWYSRKLEKLEQTLNKNLEQWTRKKY